MKVIFPENIKKIAKKIKQYKLEDKILHEISKIEMIPNYTELAKTGKIHKVQRTGDEVYLYRLDIKYRLFVTIMDDNFLILDVIKLE